MSEEKLKKRVEEFRNSKALIVAGSFSASHGVYVKYTKRKDKSTNSNRRSKYMVASVKERKENGRKGASIIDKNPSSHERYIRRKR